MALRFFHSNTDEFSRRIGEIAHAYQSAFGKPAEFAEQRQFIMLQEVDRQHRYIVAEEDGIVLGLVSWRVWGEPKEHHFAELYHIGTVQAARGKGVAKQLLRRMEEDIHGYFMRYGLRGARMIFLLTHEANADAQKFYRACGYAPDGMLAGFFHDSVNEVMFVRRFPENEVTRS